MGATPAFASLVAGIIERLTDFGYACAIVAFLCVLIGSRGRLKRLPAAICLTLVVMVALSWTEAAWVVPQMRVTAIRAPAYTGLHKRSSTIYGGVLLLGMLALGLSAAWRDEP